MNQPDTFFERLPASRREITFCQPHPVMQSLSGERWFRSPWAKKIRFVLVMMCRLEGRCVCCKVFY